MLAAQLGRPVGGSPGVPASFGRKVEVSCHIAGTRQCPFGCIGWSHPAGRLTVGPRSEIMPPTARNWPAVIDRAARHAPFLAGLIARHADLVDLISAGDIAAALAACVPDKELESQNFGKAVRIERQRLALVLALADLAGAMPLEDVTARISDFADRALEGAIRTAIAERTPGETPQGLAVLALGKHGGRELNYSSDIDPVLIFDPETLPRRGREEPGEAAVRIVRRVIELIQTRDGDGYVFRVDLRLRPSPEVTPVAIPVNAALSYYESSALPWERAAFVRARACAGDIALGERFLADIRPFIWRRGLDFGTIGDMRAISRRIREHHAAGQLFGPGYDLKRGRGGIREIEFFTQIHQLIHGGRDPALRQPATLAAITALARAGRLSDGDAGVLAEGYRVLRTIEHRLQMVDDRQTHSLPGDAAGLDSVARLHGLDDGAALFDLLRPHVEAVGALYDSLDPGGGGAAVPASADGAALDGFADPDRAAAIIAGWQSGGPRALRSPAARAALDTVLGELLAALAANGAPDAALLRFDALVDRLPSALNLFRLMQAQPALLGILADVLSHAPALAEALSRRPDLLDGLIDARAYDRMPDHASLVAELAACEPGGDYQALLDRVRTLVGEWRFALGVQLIAGRADPLIIAADYARIAEAAIACLADATIAAFTAAHGRVPQSELAIIGLGRLGGEALTYASDLDLIFLFSGDFAAESDGAKPLGATLYYNRLAQRVIGALSVPTAAGPLYDVDTRLRPSGAKGPLAVSFDAFARYQQEQAWTWEHMALARARSVYGSPEALAALDAIIAATLGTPRDHDRTLADAARMRADMRRHKPPSTPLDVKLIEGGLVDLEFIVHTLQLTRHVGLTPRLGDALAALVSEGVLDPALAHAHDLMTRMLVTLRLCCPSLDPPPPATAQVIARACGHDDWTQLLAACEAARQSVVAAWHTLFGSYQETSAS